MQRNEKDENTPLLSDDKAIELPELVAEIPVKQQLISNSDSQSIDQLRSNLKQLNAESNQKFNYKLLTALMGLAIPTAILIPLLINMFITQDPEQKATYAKVIAGFAGFGYCGFFGCTLKVAKGMHDEQQNIDKEIELVKSQIANYNNSL